MKRIKFNADQLALFAEYLLLCLQLKLPTESSTLEFLLRDHLQNMAGKLHRKSYDLLFRQRKIVQVTFSSAEVKTLSWAFKRVEIHPYLLSIEGMLIEGL